MFDISPDPVTGKRRQRSRTIRGTRADAEVQADRLVEEVDDGGWSDDGRITVRALIELWLEARKAQVAPTTLDAYRQKLAHIDRLIGHRRVRDITGGVLSGIYSRLRDEGLSGQSVLHVHRVMHKMLSDSTRWGYTPSNAAAAADPPRAQPEEREVWTADQAKAMLEVVRDHPWRVAWWLAIGAGMRRSEVAGLKWAHVDLDEKVIAVRETLVVVAGRDMWSDPKTARSRRLIAIDDSLLQVLREERLRQLELQMRDPAGWRGEGTVVCGDVGERVHPGRLSAAHLEIAKGAGIEPYITFHDLRHTHATLALAAGTPANVVKERLGHASVQLTLDRYTHRVDELHREAADAIGRLLAKT